MISSATLEPKVVRTIRLDDAAVAALLDQLDASDKAGKDETPSGERFTYRKSCVLRLQQPGDGASVNFVCPTRLLSENGVALIHGGFVHHGSRMTIQLVSINGRWQEVTGRAMSSRHIQGSIHEVRLKFDQGIDPGMFCPQAMKLRILLAEDDASMVRLAQNYFAQLNVEVDLAENGEQALERARGKLYDVILMDMEMPVKNGFEAAESLRQDGYAGVIVATTALSDPEDRERCLKAGCDRYLAKPYKLADLKELFDSCKEEPLFSSMSSNTAMTAVITAFVSEFPGKIRALDEALSSGDLKQLEFLARTLKGEAGGYGFEPITDAAARLEKAVRAGQSKEELSKPLSELIKKCLQARSSTRTQAPDTPLSKT